MAQTRGMIKITPGTSTSGEITIENAIQSTGDWLADQIPAVLNLFNWMTGSHNDAADQNLTNEIQELWNEIVDQGNMFYAEDFQYTYFGKNTQQFATSSGGTTAPQTNAQSYAQVQFKTTISQRDPDLAAYASVLQGGSILSDIFDTIAGTEVTTEYLTKRYKFIQHLDDYATLNISSTLFPPMQMQLTQLLYNVPSGQQETTFTITLTQVTDLTTTSQNTGQATMDASEPGTMPLPSDGSSDGG